MDHATEAAHSEMLTHEPTQADSTAADPADTRADATAADEAAEPQVLSPDVAAVLEQLHAGEVAGAALPLELRRRCVEHLTDEAFTTGEIAQVMRISERTVRRDRAALRRAGGVAPDARLGDELLGEFERIVTGAVGRLTRLSRESTSPPYVRLWAEQAMVRIYQRYIETAHRLNYIEDGQRRLREQRTESGTDLQAMHRRMDMVKRLFRADG